MKQPIDTSGIPDMYFAPGHRFPTVTSPSGLNKIPHLDDNDKKVFTELTAGAKMFNIEGVEQPADHMAVQMINPYMIFTSDPELFGADLRYGEDMSTLVFGLNNEETMALSDKDGLRNTDPDLVRRNRNAMLITTKVAHEYGDGWCLRLMATLPSFSLTKEQAMLLDQPQSEVWNDEERLILEFVHGMIHAKVTDDLFARAETMWGRKMLLRYAAWTTRYITLILFNHLNFKDEAYPKRLSGDRSEHAIR